MPEDIDISENVDYEPRKIEVLDETDMAINELLHAVAELKGLNLTTYIFELKEAQKGLNELIHRATRPF